MLRQKAEADAIIPALQSKGAGQARGRLRAARGGAATRKGQGGGAGAERGGLSSPDVIGAS